MQDKDIQEQHQDLHEAIESNKKRHPKEPQTHKACKWDHKSGTRVTKQTQLMQEDFDPNNFNLGPLDWEEEDNDHTPVEMDK